MNDLAKTIWLGICLWGLTMWPVPTQLLGALLIGLGAIGWLGICVGFAGWVWWRISEKDD